MRCLTLLIILVLIYIGAIFTIASRGDDLFIFNLSVVPLLTAALFFGGYEILLLAAASAILTLTLMFLHIDLYRIAQILLFLSVSAGCTYYLRYISRRILIFKEKVLEVFKEGYRASLHLKKIQDSQSPDLEKSVSDITNLYVAVKEMLSATNVEELTRCLSKSFKEQNFIFKNCRLILLTFNASEYNIEKVYEISGEIAISNPSQHHNHIIKIMQNRKEPLVVKRGSDDILSKDIIVPDTLDSIIEIPLYGKDILNGILEIEDAAEDNLTRYMVLMHQFSMVLERVRLYELIQELAIKDGLTDAFVRRHFLKRLNEELQRASSFNTHLSLMMIDIDHFKWCNDKYGHLVGDAVLKETASVLKKNIRDIDLIGRYGGEEFSVILPEVTKEGAIIAGERLRKAVDTAEIKVYDEAIHETISIGISVFPDDAAEVKQLIDKADHMLYKAKEEGRNRVESYA